MEDGIKNALIEKIHCEELENFQEHYDDSRILPNNEVVNFKGAKIMIDKSSEVTVGPVIHLNGNVTFIENNLLERSAVKKLSGQQQIENNVKKDNVESADPDISKVEDKETNYNTIFHTVADTILNVIKLPLFAITKKIAESEPTEDKENTKNQPNTYSNNFTKILWSSPEHNFLTKRDWGGVPALSCEEFNNPVNLVIIKHVGAGKIEKTFKECARRMVTIQSENIGKGLPDIYCNFFIGGDGNIYVGRGWDAQPQFKKDAIDIVFSGNFSINEPLPIMVSAAQTLIEDGIARGKIDPDYVLVGHNQVVNTLSPGVHLCEEIQKWDHYDGGLFFGNKLPVRRSQSEPTKTLLNRPKQSTVRQLEEISKID